MMITAEDFYKQFGKGARPGDVADSEIAFHRVDTYSWDPESSTFDLINKKPKAKNQPKKDVKPKAKNQPKKNSPRKKKGRKEGSEEESDLIDLIPDGEPVEERKASSQNSFPRKP